MPIFQTGGRNVLFVHIPKTGGTSVETWIRSFSDLRFFTIGMPTVLRCTPQHLTAHDMINLFGEGYFDFTFTIVRNPFDRIRSEFRMRQAEGHESFWKTFPNFSLWLEQSLETQTRDRWHLDNHLRPQWEFISSATEVFHFEDGMDDILRRVAQRLDLPTPDSVPHKMKSCGDGVGDIAWDLRDVLLMRQHYGMDFTQFGYSDTLNNVKPQ